MLPSRGMSRSFVAAHVPLQPMDAAEQREWFLVHIPHRVRAAVAHLDLRGSILDMQLSIYPPQATPEEKICWHCAANSIWEGRLAATRWLIDFVGIKEEDGNPVEPKRKRLPTDVWIKDFEGGIFFASSRSEARLLANVWRGCSKASAHPTRKTGHPKVDEPELINALKPVLQHLQDTIYSHAGLTLRDCVLVP